jgi:hypothetical protein
MSTPFPRVPGWPRPGRSLISSFVAVPALLALTACSGAAPAAPSQPTVQAAATQVVAGASPAAATLQAAASPAAATAQAAASPVTGTAAALAGTVVAAASPMASPSPSPAAQAPLRIADASLADATPWLSIMNDGDEPVELGGWHLQVGTASAELPDSAVVPPGGTLTLHAGTGLSSDDEIFLGDPGELLASAALPGTPVRLTDQDGHVIHEVTVPRF